MGYELNITSNYIKYVQQIFEKCPFPDFSDNETLQRPQLKDGRYLMWQLKSTNESKCVI